MINDSHWIFDAASLGYLILTGIGGLVVTLVGLKIKNAMLEATGVMKAHVAECKIIREYTERRLERLEGRVEHGA